MSLVTYEKRIHDSSNSFLLAQITTDQIRDSIYNLKPACPLVTGTMGDAHF